MESSEFRKLKMIRQCSVLAWRFGTDQVAEMRGAHSSMGGYVSEDGHVCHRRGAGYRISRAMLEAMRSADSLTESRARCA